ncbi:MAG: hypothetical protein NPIRA05_04480 [Nitrospirales bacterium]|nr:MAG: hypothetical protein NPIRA05_04480 [Nitrospirales bacterium]
MASPVSGWHGWRKIVKELLQPEGAAPIHTFDGKPKFKLPSNTRLIFKQGQKMSYLYILLTILFTVYGQIVLKWQVIGAGAFPQEPSEKMFFLVKLLLNPWVASGFFAAFLASLAWMAAMTKLDLSHAYPFMSLNFVLVIILSSAFFHEAITTPKIIGLGLIVLGILVGSRG